MKIQHGGDASQAKESATGGADSGVQDCMILLHGRHRTVESSREEQELLLPLPAAPCYEFRELLKRGEQGGGTIPLSRANYRSGLALRQQQRAPTAPPATRGTERALGMVRLTRSFKRPRTIRFIAPQQQVSDGLVLQ